MKHLILVTFLCVFVTNTYAQTVKLYFPSDAVNINTVGNVINKGDSFDVVIYADGNSNTSARALYFDFEYTNTAFQLLGVDHTGTGGNGGIIPYGSQISLSYNDYPGYSWKPTQANTVTDGNIKYINSSYNYTSGGSKSILRVYLNWSIASGGLGKDRLLLLHFKLKTTAPGYTWDPIKINFAAAFNQNGTAGSTIMTTPLTSVILLDPTATKYINPKLDVNANVDNFSLHRVAFTDSAANTTYLVDALADGSIPVDQTKFKPNTTYHARVLFNMDTVKDLSTAAVSVSDYTTTQAEFVTQNLDGTFRNQNIITGMGYYVADVNFNKTFDGGDLVRLFAHITGVENLVTLPSSYAAGTDMYMSVPTFTEAEFNAMTASSWKDISKNYVSFKTTNIGANLPINMKFVIPGDINRSHSSQVVIGGSIATNAIPSLKKNFATNNTANLLINTPDGIDVTLKNATITSSSIEIPVVINTNQKQVSALQFEFIYDPTKIKFEQIINEVPNTWYTFVDNKDGKIRFGSLDKELKTPISGQLTPFKIKFSAINNPLDLNTYIKVTPNMDASSKTGYQIGINLSTDSIKLTGYNNF